MRRWDRLVDGYIEEYRARGIGPATIDAHGGDGSIDGVGGSSSADRGCRSSASMRI